MLLAFLVLVAFSHAQQTSACSACVGGVCDSCPSCPLAIRGSAEPCARRAQAAELYRSTVCPARSRVLVNFEVVDRGALDAGLPAFSLLFFDSDASLAAYRACPDQAVSPVGFFPLRSCVNAMQPDSGAMSPTPMSVCIAECLQDDCSLVFRFAASCWGNDSTALGAVGLVVGVLLLAAAVFVGVRFVGSTGAWLSVGVLALLVVVMTAFWTLLLVDGTLGTSSANLQLSLKLQTAMSWLEKFALLGSVVVLLMFLHPLMVGVHTGKDALLRFVLIGIGVAVSAVFLGVMIRFHLSGTREASLSLTLLLVWFAVSSCVIMVISVALLVYSAVLLHRASNKRAPVVVIVVMTVIVAVNVVRIVVVVFSFLSFRNAILATSDSSWLYYTFSPFGFETAAAASFFAAAVLMVPQYLPLFGLVAVAAVPAFGGRDKGDRDHGNSHDVPLLGHY